MIARGLFGLAVLGLALAAAPALAQQPEPPLTWKGEGKAVALMGEEVESVDLTLSLHINEEGWTTGTVEQPNGRAKLVQFYYTYPADGVRELIMVFVSEGSETPLLAVLTGKVLEDTLMYGEVRLKAYDEDGEAETALINSNKVAIEYYPSYLSDSVEKAIKACKPVGGFMLKGGYADE